METKTIQFLIVSLFVYLTIVSADNDFCANLKIQENIENIRNHIKKLNFRQIPTEEILKQVEESFSLFLDKYDRSIKECNLEDVKNHKTVLEFYENLNNINECVMSIVKGDFENAEKSIIMVKDDQLVELMVNIYCAKETDCNNMVQFANDMDNLNVSSNIYQSLNNMLKNSRMNITTNFIDRLFEIRKNQSDIENNEAFVKLLKHALKTKIKSGTVNPLKLYKRDSNLVYDIIEEIINESIEGDFGRYAIFQIVQRSPNATIWIKHLETILNQLESKNEVHSIFGMELIREIEDIERLNTQLSETERDVINKTKERIPLFIRKLIQGEICSSITFDTAPTSEIVEKQKVFISSKSDGVYKRVKLVPKINGSFAIVNAVIDKLNVTLIVDNFDHDGQVIWNNDTLPVVNVSIENISNNDFCKMSNMREYVCAPAQVILSAITDGIEMDYSKLHKLYEYLDSIENECSKN